MQTKELDSFKLSDAITFHDELNPKLWAGNKLRPEVKMQLQEIAKDFLEEMGIHDLDVIDITVSGSNAAYSYTKHSDLDLHILVNLKDLPNNEVYKELFQAKKTLYNDSHNITIHGVPVELYVQDANEPVVSLGEYSIKNDKWIKIPTKRRANFDQTASRLKYNKLLDIIKLALKSKNLAKVNKILKKIKQYRQAGLDKGGEFGPENLAYKALRSQGYITKLYGLRDKLHSEMLTIENMYAREDYHPNSKPRGPEFKPTMPKGTVKVDVSDVYDWYKLGQHISNMKGLGKHDFGAGPPSTILSFGDEDTEHKYIKDLEKTGLTTTDIDPVDPKQPKGMKRQKVDPTYNVSEARSSGYKEIEFVCVNPQFPDATDPKLQQQMYAGLQKIPGVIPLWQDQSDYSEGQSSLTAIYKDRVVRKEILKLAKQLGVTVDLEQPVSDSYVDRAIRGEHEGQRSITEIDNQSSAKTGIYQSEVYGTKAYHSKCLEKGCDWESRRYDRIKQAQDAAKKHAQTHIKSGVTEDETLQFASEKTPAINPYGGLKDRQYRGAIAETFDNPYPIKWEKSEFGDYDALATLPDGNPLTIMFNHESPDEVVITFWRNNNLDLTGEGDAQRVFATVLQAIQEFLKIERPATISFSASKEVEPGQNMMSRSKLYDRLVKRYAQQWGYDAQSINHEEGVVYNLHRKQNVSEASGYIPSEKEKNDPRFKTALTVDVKPDSIKKNAKSFYWKTSRAGIPPTARADGKF